MAIYLVGKENPREVIGPFTVEQDARDAATRMALNDPGNTIFKFIAQETVVAGERPVVWTQL
jgi:hypothetical protein